MWLSREELLWTLMHASLTLSPVGAPEAEAKMNTKATMNLKFGSMTTAVLLYVMSSFGSLAVFL